MAATSYTTLPSSTYAGLGSQGDLYHSANYGTYDSGIGSITAQPYQYPATNYGTHLPDNQQQPSYSNDYLQSTYSNDGYSTQQPQYYPTDRYAQQPTYNQEPLLNDYTNSQTQKYNDQSTISNHINITQPSHKTTIDSQNVESNNQFKTSYGGSTQYRPPDNQSYQSQPPSQSNRLRPEHDTSSQPPSKQQSQSSMIRSEHQASNHPSKQPPPARHRSPSNGGTGYPSESTTKMNNQPIEMKTTKSQKMRAAAIKQKDEVREQKQKDGNFPSTKKKSTPPKSTKSQEQPARRLQSEGDQSDTGKSKRDKKQSHSLSKTRKSRRDDYQTEDNNSSVDEDTRNRGKSKKGAAFSDSYGEKHPSLPPLRRGRAPPYYEPFYDHSFPPGQHSFRGRYPPYYDDYPYPPGRYDYRPRHLYEDAYGVPPYLASYHDPYDGFFDYEKRKTKSNLKKHKDKKETTNDQDDVTGNETEHEDDKKSPQSKKSKKQKNLNKDDEEEEHTRRHWPAKYYEQPYYDENDMLEAWRQERNDYLKKKFKPTVHDVLYAQQWMKSDSYLENQRRRALRDSQGYYFPYKKYNLKDYKDLQKAESQRNPYASINDTTLDRKERAKKRQEYASHIERQPAEQNKTSRDLPPRKPWHLSHGETNDPEKLSKRERALEYAKVQVVKHRPHKAPKNRYGGSDPTEEYVNNLFPHTNDDGELSRNNQSGDDDDQ